MEKIEILIFLLILSPEITIGLTVFFGFLGLIFYKLVQTKASIWGEQSKIYRGLKLKNQKESFGAIRDIKILGKEKNFINIFSSNNFMENEYTKKHSFVLSLPKILSRILPFIFFISVFYNLVKLENNNELCPLMDFNVDWGINEFSSWITCGKCSERFRDRMIP